MKFIGRTYSSTKNKQEIVQTYLNSLFLEQDDSLTVVPGAPSMPYRQQRKDSPEAGNRQLGAAGQSRASTATLGILRQRLGSLLTEQFSGIPQTEVRDCKFSSHSRR